jgi:anaerobic selenocysteine-containing dehydrogenase
VYNANPATTAPNQNLVLRGLKRQDLLTVVVEHFLTDTARYADYVFPSATQVEVLDLVRSWGQSYIALNRPAVTPPGEAVPNTEFFRRLAAKLDLKEPYLFDSDEAIVLAALNTGHPYLKGITYERLAEEGWAPLNLPQPFVPFAEGRFPTPSGKCEFYSGKLKNEGMDPLPAYQPSRQNGGNAYPLRFLTSRASKHFLNSSNAGVARAIEAQGKPTLTIHTADAAPRGIRDGGRVRVFNERGEMSVWASGSLLRSSEERGLRALVRSTCREGFCITHGGYYRLFAALAFPPAFSESGSGRTVRSLSDTAPFLGAGTTGRSHKSLPIRP